jgi:hypothetical protein
MDKMLGKHVFVFNSRDNSGEALMLATEIYTNGDNIYLQQELTLQSYCNSASFQLTGSPMTPDKLRELADQLEEKMDILEELEETGVKNEVH